MSTTTPPQTPAAGAVHKTTVKQEVDTDNMIMDNAPEENKFTPINDESDSNDASDADEEPVAQPTPKATPKKRGAAAIKEEGADESPAKKRAPAKPKAAKEPKAPKAKVVKEKATKASSAKSNSRPIPQTFEEADEADKLLVEMKNKGSSWKAIKDMWVAKTGQVPGGSTLSGRYARIKDNLAHLEPGEAEELRESVKAVEARLMVEKWTMVAAEMENRGCNKYSNAFLQKQLKIIEQKIAKGTYVPEMMPAKKGGKSDDANSDEDVDAENGEEDDGVKDEEEDDDVVKDEDEEED